MSIRVTPVVPAVKTSLQRRPFGYIATPPVPARKPGQFKELLDEVQKKIQSR